MTSEMLCRNPFNSPWLLGSISTVVSNGPGRRVLFGTGRPRESILRGAEADILLGCWCNWRDKERSSLFYGVDMSLLTGSCVISQIS
jgi:hypothetical protein